MGTLGQSLLPSRPSGQRTAPGLGTLRALSCHIDISAHSPKIPLLVFKHPPGICRLTSIANLRPPHWNKLLTPLQSSNPSSLPHWTHCPIYPDHSLFLLQHPRSLPRLACMCSSAGGNGHRCPHLSLPRLCPLVGVPTAGTIPTPAPVPLCTLKPAHSPPLLFNPHP